MFILKLKYFICRALFILLLFAYRYDVLYSVSIYCREKKMISFSMNDNLYILFYYVRINKCFI